jgi:hypothetical protein
MGILNLSRSIMGYARYTSISSKNLSVLTFSRATSSKMLIIYGPLITVSKILALEKSPELMDILTFVKEVEFEIKDNLGFDVLWDSMMGKQYAHVRVLLLEWLGYTNKSDTDKKRYFIKLLESNNIQYHEITHKDPLVKRSQG